MPGVTHDSRIKDFKNTGKHDEMRRRRAEGSVELRKAKKEDNLMKRRNMMPIEDDESDLSDRPSDPTSPKKASDVAEMTLEECAAVLIADWASSDAVKKEAAAENVRRKLSRSNSPPIQHIIKLGLVSPLIRLLSEPPTEKAQFEAAWALTNIVSGTAEETGVVVAAGGIKPLVATLSVPQLYIAEQAAWALGNVAGDGAALRDAVLEAGVLAPMIELARRPDVSVEFLRTLAWAFSNFCRHKNPPPSIELIRGLLPYMAQLLLHPDKVVRTDTCWAMSYITDGSDEQIEAALAAGILPTVMGLLNEDDRALQAPALRTLGNIVTGSDTHTQAVIDAGVLSGRLRELLQGPNANLLKECVWMVSNVMAGNAEQIQAVIDAGLLRDIATLLAKGEHKVRHEAAWAVVNLTTGGTAAQAMALVDAGVVPALTTVLTVKDNRIVSILLEALYNLLEKAQSLGHLDAVSALVEEAEGLDKLEELQNHEDEAIYNKALSIIEKFFSDEETQDDAVEVEAAPTKGYEF